LVVYPLLVVLAVGLFAAACEFYCQRREQRQPWGALAFGLMVALVTAFIVWWLWMSCACNGSAIFSRPRTAGELCAARGGSFLSLKPLFQGCVHIDENAWNRESETRRVIDALISISIEVGVMNTTVCQSLTSSTTGTPSV
jgi:hypothetical protein